MTRYNAEKNLPLVNARISAMIRADRKFDKENPGVRDAGIRRKIRLIRQREYVLRLTKKYRGIFRR